MIVSCPNCSTKYNLPDDKVPASGIKVKCSKCSHLFRVQPPAATPEEEVEVLLDENADAQPEQDQSSDFDAAFEEAVAGGDDLADGDDDVDDNLDDLGLGDSDETEASDDEADLDDSFDDDLGDLGLGEDADDDEDDLGGEDDDLDIDDLDDAEDDDEDDFGIDDDEEDSGSDLNLGKEGGLFDSLDGGVEEPKVKKRSKLGKLLKTLLLVLLLIIIAAIGTFNFGLWSLPASAPAIELPFDLPIKVPFVKGSGAMGGDMDGDMDGQADAAGDGAGDGVPSDAVDPTENVKKIQPVEFSQYFISNEVEGSICVVEAKALNNSDTAKEQIKVEVSLFAADGTVLAAKEALCGNTLSLFQLQVDDRATIEENLSSARGINLNNSFIKPGESAPFMVVFYDVKPEQVEEYKITIIEAMEPQR